MKLTLTDREPKFTTSHRKESAGLYRCYAMLITDPGNPYRARAVAELRIYQRGSGAPTACLWISAPKVQYRSGSGTVKGYGINKHVAAAQAAIENAGYDVSMEITGEQGIRDALRQIAILHGCADAMLFETAP